MNRLILQFTRVAAWLSQGVNCILLFGHHDQTVSGRAYESGVLRGHDQWRTVQRTIDRVWILFGGEADHCRRSHERDLKFCEERSQ